MFGKKKRPQVRIKSTRASKTAEGEKLYEIQPASYAGPWELPAGTVLEIVSTPKKGSS